MKQYIVLIQNNLKSKATSEEWEVFFHAAMQSCLFKGGSVIGERIPIGDTESAISTDHIGGFMRFESDNVQKILDLLESHPVVIHGGSLELCEMPKS